MPSPDRQSLFRQMGRRKSLFDSTVQTAIQQHVVEHVEMLWNMWSITRHKRSYGHPLHPDLTPDVLTCVLPLGTVSSGRESEVESAHLFLTIIQFLSACHLTSQVSKLNHDSMRQAFINDISNQLGAMNLSSEDPEENWTVFQKVVHSSAATTIGHPSRKHQDWFDENDEEIKLLLEEKHCLHKAHQDDTSSVSKKAAYNNICNIVQNRLRDMQDSWLSKKAEEIQSFADRKDMKKFHDALKTIYGPIRAVA